MRKIKGYVKCESSQRLLSRFKISWYDDSQQESKLEFGSESEGFFELVVPDTIKQIFVVKDSYLQSSITLLPNFNSYVAKIRKQA
jgi:hypothetical protein